MTVPSFPFLFANLAYPAACIFVLTAAISLLATRSAILSFAAAAIKAGFFLVYFSVFFDGTYVFYDDRAYLSQAAQFVQHGVGITTLGRDWVYIIAVSGSHFVYQIFNTYAYYIFGAGYFSPVALTILLTPPAAWLGTVVAAREFGFTGGLRPLFFFYFLLFPDLLAWSSLVNGKDVLVLLFHVVLLACASLVFQGRLFWGLAIAFVTSLVLFSLRFYVPLMFGVAMSLSMFFSSDKQKRGRLTVLSLGMVMLFLGILGPSTILWILTRLRADLVNPVFGFVRFLLTPIPLHTDPNFAFLDLPATFHWLMLPVSILGFFTVARMRTRFSGFFLCYFLVFTLLYSVYGELQEPRHRTQLDFAWAVFQFAGLLRLVMEGRRAARKLPALSEESAQKS